MARTLFRIAHAFDDARVLPRRPRPAVPRSVPSIQLRLPLEVA
jgi:hypothetical protein